MRYITRGLKKTQQPDTAQSFGNGGSGFCNAGAKGTYDPHSGYNHPLPSHFFSRGEFS
jgi:hypothetical protein